MTKSDVVYGRSVSAVATSWCLFAVRVAAIGVSTFGLAEDAAASAPIGRYTIGTGIVTDTMTGLVWQREVPGTKMTWNEAMTFCPALTAFGGGWRLPTGKELQTIVDETRTFPAIDVLAFPNTPSEAFWSSSPSHVWAGVTYAWEVDFVYGASSMGSTGGVSRNYSVRCVR